MGHQAATFAIKQTNLLNHWVTGLIEQQLVAVAISVFGQQMGIKRVVFAMVLGLDFLQDRGLLQRTDPPPECQMLQEGVVVASGVFEAQHRRVDGCAMLGEPLDELLVSGVIVAGLASGFDHRALVAVPERHIERVLGDIDADKVGVVIHRVVCLECKGYQEHAGQLGSIKGLLCPLEGRGPAYYLSVAA